MDINDYSTRLAQTRNRFSEAQQELKENYSENVRELEKLHEKKTENQRENYLDQKLAMEERAQDRLTRYDKNLKQELADRTERYMNNLEGERKSFNEDRKRMMSDYNQKLSSISKSFETSSTEKDKLHALYKDNMTERYEDGLTQREKDFNEKLSKLNEVSSTKINDYRDLTNREKRKLITDFDNERKQLVQDANIARNRDNSRHQLEMERLREAGKQNETVLKNNFDSANTTLRQTKNDQIERQRDTFESLSQDIQERNQAELTKLNRQNKAEKRDLERSFASDRLSLERQTNALLNEGAGNKLEDTRNKQAAQHENRIKNLKDAMDENNHTQALLNERLANGHSNELKKMEVRHNTDLDKKNEELRKLRQEEIGGIKERFSDYQELMAKRNKMLERQKEEESVQSRKRLTNALDTQRTEFARQINQINSANQKASSEIRNQMSEDQARFIENTKIKVHNEMAELKDDLRTTFSKKEESLNQRIDNKEMENKKLEEAYQKKLDTMQAKAYKELEKLKVIEHQRRMAEKRAADRQIDQNRREFEKTLTALRREFDRKIARTKSNKDLTVAKLTNRYEKQLDRERNEHTAEMDRQKKIMMRDYQHLLHKTNLEKENLINQYELKIDKLREANRLASEMRSLKGPEKA